MKFYRSNFSSSSISPKLHFLEDHVVSWIQHWKLGLSFHEEQAAESIHAAFNELQQKHASIRNPVDRLMTSFKYHHLNNCSAIL